MPYFSGQGTILLGPVGSKKLVKVGNAPTVNIEMTAETLEHQESISGQRSVDLRLITKKSAQVTLTLEDFTLDNLGLGLYGVKTTRAGSTVVAESLGTVAVGDIISLVHPKVSTVVIKDSAGSPATVPGANYIVDPTFGTVTILNIGAFVMPFKADYAYAASDDVIMFTASPPQRRLVAQIINTADNNNLWQVELYKVQFNPISAFNLILEELGQIELVGSALVDATLVIDPTLGQFGRVQQL